MNLKDLDVIVACLFLIILTFLSVWIDKLWFGVFIWLTAGVLFYYYMKWSWHHG